MQHDHEMNLMSLMELGEIGMRDAFHYGDQPLAKEYERFFQWAQEDLSSADRYNLVAKIYFDKNEFLNAFAPVKDGVLDRIAIYRGLFDQTHHLYNNPTAPLETRVLSDFKEHFRIELPRFLHDITLRFIYYHELAHLIQNNHLVPDLDDPNSAIEMGRMTSEPHPHAKEYDADLYACSRLVEHFKEIWNAVNPEVKTASNFRLLLSSFVSSLLSLFVFMREPGFELIGPMHPHPVVRVTYLLERFFELIKEVCGTSFEVDKDAIVTDSWNIVEQLFANNPLVPQEFRTKMQHTDTIRQYIETDLTVDAKRHPELIINRTDVVWTSLPINLTS